jgi:CDP-diacylglycerol--glycerol-3-phosphate 3-phosphatidyltransferase
MIPLNVPNLLTVVRILLVPALLAALLADTAAGDVLAAVLFAAASATDFLDGRIARARASVTTFGRLMDPLADKLLVIAALLALVSLHRLAAWVAMVIIARELAVTVLRLGAGAGAGALIGASALGKAKTAAQIAVILAVITVRSTPLWLSVAIYLMVALTVCSGLDYFFGLRRHLADARRGAERSLSGPAAPANPRG